MTVPPSPRPGSGRFGRAVLLAACLGASAPRAAAQLPSASAAHMGTAENYTALARGFAANALNPAGLALPGSPGFSLALLPVGVRQGLGPVTLPEIAEFEGQPVPSAAREAWLSAIETEGGQRGTAALEASGLSLNAGPVGFQVSAVGVADASLNPDAAELILFGNAGRTGEPRDFDLAGSRFAGFALTTAGLSFGLPLGISLGWPGDRLAVGVTLKYSVGNVLLLGRDVGSSLSSDPLQVELEFPVLQSDSAFADTDLDAGRGVGMDLGLAWEGGPWSLGATVRNVFHTFEWDVDGFYFRPGTALFDEETSDSDFDSRPGSEAPPALLRAAESLTVEPEAAVGVAFSPSGPLTVTAEARRRFGDGLPLSPETHVGVGAELRLVPFLPLRAGVAKITDGTQIGGGLGLALGPVNLAGAALLRTGAAGEGFLAQIGLSFGGR